MANRYFLPAVIALATACAKDSALPAADAPLPMRSFVSPLGIAFDLPVDFTTTQSDFATLFQGPEHTDAYYTTVALQSRSAPLKLDLALAETFVDMQAAATFAWLQRTPTNVGTAPGMFYGVEFEFNEAMNTEVGVLLVHNGFLVDLSCLAPTELLHTAIPICESILGSAHVL